MTLKIEKFNILTNSANAATNDIIDITSKVENIIAASGVKEGILNLYCESSNAAIFSFKYDETLISKLAKKLNSMLDMEFNYKEKEVETPFEVSSLIKTLILGKNLSLPIINGKLFLEKNNRIFLADFNKFSAQAQNLTLTLVLTY